MQIRWWRSRVTFSFISMAKKHHASRGPCRNSLEAKLRRSWRRSFSMRTRRVGDSSRKFRSSIGSICASYRPNRAEPVSFDVELETIPGHPAGSLRFHASFSESLFTPEDGDHPVLDVRGRGHLAGSSMVLCCIEDRGFLSPRFGHLEGDDSERGVLVSGGGVAWRRTHEETIPVRGLRRP